MRERLNSIEIAGLLGNVEPHNVLGVTNHSISILREDSENSLLTLNRTVASTWYIPGEGPVEEIWVGSHERLTKIWMDLSRDELLNSRS